jgi:hypothetical protein
MFSHAPPYPPSLLLLQRTGGLVRKLITEFLFPEVDLLPRMQANEEHLLEAAVVGHGTSGGGEGVGSAAAEMESGTMGALRRAEHIVSTSRLSLRCREVRGGGGVGGGGWKGGG